MSGKAAVERVTHVGARRTLGPGVANRFVVEADDLRANSPFILLVEDFIEPQGDFHEHPHRGLDTVTFILSGSMQHGDHLGNGGTLKQGDVQWVTAGRGIIHGGMPAAGSSVHALQLWLNLPNALRGAAPATRVQRRDGASTETHEGVTFRTHGANGTPPWSRYPITLRDIASITGGSYRLPITADERCFVYLLEGTPRIGGQDALPGDVLWCSVVVATTLLDLEANEAFRLIAYSGQPIDEPVIARGPFVAGTEAELEMDFADLRAGRVVTTPVPIS